MRIGLAALLVTVLGAGPLTAQDVSLPFVVPSPVMTIDQEQLYGNSLWGQRAKRELEAASAALAAENRRIETSLTEEERSLTDQRASLSPEEFRRLADAFDARVVEIRQAQEAKAREITRRRDAESQAFFAALVPILSQEMEARGIVAILDRRALLLAAESIDLTDSVLSRVDLELGEGAAPDPVGSEDPDGAETAPPGAPVAPGEAGDRDPP